MALDKVLPCRGVQKFNKDVRDLELKIEQVNKFLDAVEEGRIDREVHGDWIRELESFIRDANDAASDINDYCELVDALNKVGKKACLSSLLCFNFRRTRRFERKMAPEIKYISREFVRIHGYYYNNRDLVDQLREANLTPVMYGETTAACNGITEGQSVVGRNKDVDNILIMLSTPPDSESEAIRVIPIVGMDGLGKTTLTQLIFNHHLVLSHFHTRIWITMSVSFDNDELVYTRMLEQLHHVDLGDRGMMTREEVIRKLGDDLAGKKYLLVLDDCRNVSSDCWDDFINVLTRFRNPNVNGNAIIVTTNNRKSASTVVSRQNDLYNLGKLSNDECWSIIKAITRPGDQVEFEREVGYQIARSCGGLPLVAKLVGEYLRGKNVDEWATILKAGVTEFLREANPVLQLLKQDFGDLISHSSLRNCMAFCSVFAQGSEIHRDELIQLWMAHGLLRVSEEYKGSQLFDKLLLYCFFQEPVQNEFGEVEHCKMHDLVRDFVCSLPNSLQIFVLGKQIGDGLPKLIRFPGKKWLEKGINENTRAEASSARALLLHGNIPNQKLSLFERLHSLVVRNANELPSSVEKLIYLRYLDVSHNPIRSLPTTICKLYNLQTLRIFSRELQQLPEKLCNLISLRHLCFYDDLIDLKMPPEIRRLSNLQTLSAFYVSNKEACKINELGYLKNLTGKLTICNLQRLSDEEEAKRADLIHKPNVYKLSFIWRASKTIRDWDKDVLEGLQPHPDLKGIVIEGFSSEIFPQWTMNMESLNNLIKITLKSCNLCTEIPMLGHLPTLEHLELDSLPNVRSIGPSFYGADSDNASSCQERRAVFPALKRLLLKNMRNLLDWSEAQVVPEMQAFPRLEYLELSVCPELKTVPSRFPCLNDLQIRSIKCDSLVTEICNNNPTSIRKLRIVFADELTCPPFYNNQNLQEIQMIHCLKLRELTDGLHNLRYLVKLEIVGCLSLESISYPGEQEGLSFLRHLEISSCPGLSNLPSEFLQSCTSLESLKLYELENLTWLPVDFGEMTHLSALYIHNCPKLTSPAKMFDNLSGLTELSIGNVTAVDLNSLKEALIEIQHLKNLRKLYLHGSPHLETIPDELENLKFDLESLHLFDFGIEALPKCLGGFPYLEQLELWRCKKLKPSEGAMGSLTQLKSLLIRDCPLLKKMYAQPGSTSWHHPNTQVQID